MKMIPKNIVSGPAKARGFTLLELMITVLVIGILSAIAYASYQNLVVNSRRSAATACLSEAAQFMERYNTTNQTYVGATLPAFACQTELAAFYTFAIAGTSTATAFSVAATPVGHQLARDGTKCGTLTLTSTGARTASGTNGAACW